MTAASILVAALILDAALGEPDWLWSRAPHPAVLMGRLIGWCDATFNTGRARKVKGVFTLLCLVAIAWGAGHLLSLAGPIMECLITAVLLAHRSLVQHVSAVADGLRISLDQGRDMVARIVSRDTSDMDTDQTARAAIESAAENMSDGVVAPAFWYLIGGLPGLLIYKIVNTADSMIGYRTPRHAAFGWAAARSDDLLNLVPARATAVLIILVARVRDWRSIPADARQHRSPNAGWPEAAMARALNIALAGPRAYDGEMRPFAWVNPEGRRALGTQDIDATVSMLWKVWGSVLAFTLIVAFVSL